MSETASSSGAGGPFSSFWHRSTDKLSPKKFKFVQNNVAKPTNVGKGGEDTATAALNAKQHRRAQVRKAQIEHRQRKANHVKHLEQDVSDLREMIAAAETEALLAEQENAAIKKMIARANIPIPNIPISPLGPTSPVLPAIQTEPIDLFQLIPPQNDTQTSPQNNPGLQGDSPWDSDSSLVSIIFDELVEQACLHVSPSTGSEPLPEIVNSPDIFNFPDNAFNPASTGTKPLHSFADPSNINTLSATVSQPLPPNSITHKEPLDLATVAINFILALEHPCRTHFHHHSPDAPFDPTGDPGNHELMASTLMYSSAPEPVFTNFEAGPRTWTCSKNSEESLKQLEAMSTSLPKSDWEITPVQAWFRIMERYGVSWLIAGNSTANGQGGENALGVLKKELGKIVSCFGFGAVMDELKFWDIVNTKFGLGEQQGPAGFF